MLLFWYNLLSIILLPINILVLVIRFFKNKENKISINHRLSIIKNKRPEGFLLWVHVASIGELIVALTVIKAINKLSRNITVLITTGTLSSAKILENNLPSNVEHQFLPFDNIIFVKKFLNHWNPNLAIFIESEIWPCLISECAKVCKMLLINARISNKSYGIWKLIPNTFKSILSNFDRVIVQSQNDLNKFNNLGVNASYIGNIKFCNEQLSVNNKAYSNLSKIFHDKKIIVFASTHIDDELAMMHCITQFKKEKIDNIYFIVIPRHPYRLKDLIKLSQDYSISSCVYSNNNLPDITKELFIVDTFGVLGTFYKLADIVFIGGSFGDRICGHNPIEPAKFGKLIMFGYNMSNFENIAAEMINQNAALQVTDRDDLYQKLIYHSSSKAIYVNKQYENNAQIFSKQFDDILNKYMNIISYYIN